jgi:hypothetical protein
MLLSVSSAFILSEHLKHPRKIRRLLLGKDILISVAAASTDSDQKIIQDPSNRLNETY